MTKKTPDLPRRRLSREKQQELESLRQIESCFDDWLFHRTEDIGEDRVVQIFEDGESTGLAFCLQAKSQSGSPPAKPSGRQSTYRFEVKDLEHWEKSATPVVLMVWNVKQRRGRWIEIRDAIADLDERRPRWRSQRTATVVLPSTNTTTSKGKARLRGIIAHRQLPVLARGQRVVFKPTFEFPSNAAGRKAMASLKRAIEEGYAVTVPGKYVKNFRASEWWERAIGREVPKRLTISSGPSERSVPIKLVATLRDVTRVVTLDLRSVRGGTKVIHLSTKHGPSPIRIDARMPAQRPPGNELTLDMSLGIDFPGASVAHALEAAPVLGLLLEGGHASVVLPSGSRAPLDGIDMSTFPWSADEMRTWEQFLAKLSFVETRAGRFGRFDLSTLRDEDFKTVEELYSICLNGEYETPVNLAFDVEEPLTVDEGENIEVSLHDGVVELLGVRIPLGPATQDIRVNSAVKKALSEPERVKGGFRVVLKTTGTLRFPAWKPPRCGPGDGDAA